MPVSCSHCRSDKIGRILATQNPPARAAHLLARGYDNENSYTSQMVRTINMFGKKAASGAVAAENAERPCAKVRRKLLS